MICHLTPLALFLVSNRGVIVVDCPPTIGHKILWAIGNLTSQPITHVVYSHVHADHIGAAWIFGNKVTTIAHIDTARYLEFTPDSNRPVPDITFHGSYSLRVGNQSLELSYKGEVHVQGNIFIYAPTQKVLMLVDVVFPGWIPFALLGQTKYLPGFIRAHDQILAYDFDHYIGGHLGRSGNRTDVLIQREYVRDLFTNCVWAVNQSATNDPNIGAAAIFGPVMTKNPGNPWAAFKVYLDTLAEVCADLTNKKWLGKLGGADVFQFENAGVVIESLRLDYGILGPSGTV
jgi:glyoxylase-like metal-dependent hydrolase (beta-lactamase superfamily II)